MQDFELKKLPIVATDPAELKEFLFNILINGSDKNKKVSHLITFNLDNFRLFCENPDYSTACRNADYIFPDGTGVTCLLRIKYGKKIKRITGHDIFKTVLGLSNKLPLRIALVGSLNDTLVALENKLKQEYSQISVIYKASPPLYFETDCAYNNRIIAELEKLKPDILFLALGCPRQEIWISRYKDIIGAKINIGLGSVFDIYAGKKKRAPKIMQNNGLEWLWRLLCEPSRLFKRYMFYDIRFFLTQLYRIINGKEI